MVKPISTDDVPDRSITAEKLSIASTDYSGEDSFQVLPPDLNVGSGVGTSAAGDTSHIAAIMGHIIGAVLTKTRNYLAGVIGKFTVTGTKATTYPAGGVLGIIGDGVTEADGGVVSVLDGDSAKTNAIAAFKARGLNSVPGSGFDFGLDVFDDGGVEYPNLSILKADIRCSNEVVWLNVAGVPVDGTTGANFAEKGSLATDRTNGNLYINAGTKASPVWKLVTRAA